MSGCDIKDSPSVSGVCQSCNRRRLGFHNHNRFDAAKNKENKQNKKNINDHRKLQLGGEIDTAPFDLEIDIIIDNDQAFIVAAANGTASKSFLVVTAIVMFIICMFI